MSEQVQTPEAVEERAGRISVLATIGLFAFLIGVLGYAYPHFLPGAPEQAVKRFLTGQQSETWDYVELMLVGPLELKVQYVAAASHCRLTGFDPVDPFFKRLRWALGRAGDDETLRMREYYTSGSSGNTVKVEIEYALQRRGGEYFIAIDSILGEGGVEQYLHDRGVPL